MGFILFFAFIGFLIWAYTDNEKKQKRQLEHLQSIYQAALLGGDKAHALQAGRAYYSFMRKGKQLTLYDEQAIANDLSTMK